jgi:hypothetical protein
MVDRAAETGSWGEVATSRQNGCQAAGSSMENFLKLSGSRDRQLLVLLLSFACGWFPVVKSKV